MSDDSKSWKDEKYQTHARGAAAGDKSTAAKASITKEAADKHTPVAETVAAAPQAAPTPAAKPAPAGPAPGAPAAPLVGRQQVEVDDSEVNVCYANFCRVTGTPEELIVDFGLNAQPYGTPTKPIKVQDRVVMNMYTAKRMLHALHMTIQRHETAFGRLETDVQKRVVAAPRPQ
jgi:hypothetical protein